MSRPMWDDLLEANQRYADHFALEGVPGKAARHLAVVTCMDSRIEPLPMLGLAAGDAKVMRTAGGRINDGVLRSLVLATNLLDVERILVLHHTRCAMVATNEAIGAKVAEASGREVPGWDWGAIADPDADLASDVERVRSCDLIADSVAVVGWRYDVDTGRVVPIVG